MRDVCEEFALRTVRGLGFDARGLELPVVLCQLFLSLRQFCDELFQLAGPFADAPFQVLVQVTDRAVVLVKALDHRIELTPKNVNFVVPRGQQSFRETSPANAFHRRDKNVDPLCHRPSHHAHESHAGQHGDKRNVSRVRFELLNGLHLVGAHGIINQVAGSLPRDGPDHQGRGRDNEERAKAEPESKTSFRHCLKIDWHAMQQ